MAWCSLKCDWDAFIIEIQTPESVKSVLDRLMEENKDNLEDPSDTYAKGYHDALVDILKELGCPTDEKHFDRIKPKRAGVKASSLFLKI